MLIEGGGHRVAPNGGTCHLQAIQIFHGGGRRVKWVATSMHVYFTILNQGRWLASNDRPIPMVPCTNKGVHG